VHSWRCSVIYIYLYVVFVCIYLGKYINNAVRRFLKSLGGLWELVFYASKRTSIPPAECCSCSTAIKIYRQLIVKKKKFKRKKLFIPLVNEKNIFIFYIYVFLTIRTTSVVFCTFCRSVVEIIISLRVCLM
jgi:hypothetical protein